MIGIGNQHVLAVRGAEPDGIAVDFIACRGLDLEKHVLVVRVKPYVENFIVIVNQVAFGSRLTFHACLHLSFDFVHAIDGNRVGVVVVAPDREVVKGVAVVFREVSEVDGIGHVAGVLGVFVLSLHDDIGSVVRCIYERTVSRAYPSFALRICPSPG